MITGQEGKSASLFAAEPAENAAAEGVSQIPQEGGAALQSAKNAPQASQTAVDSPKKSDVPQASQTAGESPKASQTLKIAPKTPQSAENAPQALQKTDEALVLLAKTGDEAALSELFKKYEPLRKSFLNRYYLQGAEKEDLEQEVSLGFYYAILSYQADGGAAFLTFAATCIRRRVFSELQKDGAQKNRAFRSCEELTEEQPSPFLDPLSVMERDETAAGIEKTLTSGELAVYRLFIKGFRPQEIAAEIGKSVRSVENTVARIRKKTKEYLASAGK